MSGNPVSAARFDEMIFVGFSDTIPPYPMYVMDEECIERFFRCKEPLGARVPPGYDHIANDVKLSKYPK